LATSSQAEFRPKECSARGAPEQVRVPVHPPWGDLFGWAGKLEARLKQLPGLVDVSSDLQVNNPEVMIDIDQSIALRLGIDADRIRDTLYSAFGMREVADIFRLFNDYRVLLEVGPQFQETSEDLQCLHLRAANGALVPMSTFASTRAGRNAEPTGAEPPFRHAAE
jgi:HAE1 family hydrophobic/amphiphilic exporter-1